MVTLWSVYTNRTSLVLSRDDHNNLNTQLNPSFTYFLGCFDADEIIWLTCRDDFSLWWMKSSFHNSPLLKRLLHAFTRTCPSNHYFKHHSSSMLPLRLLRKHGHDRRRITIQQILTYLPSLKLHDFTLLKSLERLPCNWDTVLHSIDHRSIISLYVNGNLSIEVSPIR